MALTADFIRSLSGLSAAELPDTVITTLRIVEITETSASNYPDLSDLESLYYQGYKAITILSSYILGSLPETIRDNFNQFSRFDNAEAMIGLAHAKVAEVEAGGELDSEYAYDLMTVVAPDIDPVISEGR